MMVDIKEIVEKIKANVSDLPAEKNKVIDISKIPRVALTECLERYICAVDEEGNVAYYARIADTAKKNKIGGNWMATFLDGLRWMAHQDLTGEQWKVFATICSMIDFDNYIRVNQTALAKELHTNQANVSRSIKKLIDLDIITEGPRAGLYKTYMLNPNIGIKGKHKQDKIIDYAEKKRARQLEKDNETSKENEPNTEN